MAAEILLLAKRAEEIRVIQDATSTDHLNVVAECRDILKFLKRQDEHRSAPRPDLIILDLDLSITEDCETLTDIKRDPEFKRIPVVVLASSDRYEDVFQAYDLHANAYIRKPADRKQLVEVVRATLHFWLALARLPKD